LKKYLKASEDFKSGLIEKSELKEAKEDYNYTAKMYKFQQD
jgi:hypothetical protein